LGFYGGGGGFDWVFAGGYAGYAGGGDQQNLKIKNGELRIGSLW